ncbi:MAG: A/G-specific adenine glycosylase [Pseudomonadota bacterium]
MQSFAERLIIWQREHGRNDLPWQRDVTAYRVWVSEIMLQQTQVAAVIPYYERFMARFPTLDDLANAPVDDVLHLWSGLGYYSRARNLLKAAQRAAATHGELPADLEALMALPGIGRSTAGAILSLAWNRRAAILEGNVKRVLSRHVALDGWPGSTANLRTLWALAEDRTPDCAPGRYAQAVMDLGATVCVRRRPHCLICPVNTDCGARARGLTDAIPASKPKRARPLRRTCFLVARRDSGEVLLKRRPPTGIWGGLWCFPESSEWLLDDAGAGGVAPAHASSQRVKHEPLADWLSERGLKALDTGHALPPIQHGFTHFELAIEPHVLAVAPRGHQVLDRDDELWCDPLNLPELGLAAPVSRLLQSLGRPAPRSN